MDAEVLQVVEYIQIEDFRHKMKLTKEHVGKAYVEIIEDHICIDRLELQLS